MPPQSCVSAHRFPRAPRSHPNLGRAFVLRLVRSPSRLAPFGASRLLDFADAGLLFPPVPPPAVGLLMRLGLVAGLAHCLQVGVGVVVGAASVVDVVHFGGCAFAVWPTELAFAVVAVHDASALSFGGV